jgi:hypothetical protein
MILGGPIKMEKVDSAGIFIGFLISLTAWVRYSTHPADFGETFIAGVLGLLWVIVFLMHHNQTKLANTLDDVEIYLADLNQEE